MRRQRILAHRANYGGKRQGGIEYIVMHYTANDGDSGTSNGRYFEKQLTPPVSAHYFVDDWGVTQTVPDEYVAYHCGAASYRHPTCRNVNSIGVELCDTVRDGTVKPSEQTLKNAAALVGELMERYEVPIAHVVRHYDVTGKRCPAYWVEKPEDFAAFKKRVTEKAEMVEKSEIILDGKRVAVERILKGGVNYTKIRDLAAALGLEVGFEGSIAKLSHRQAAKDGR